MRTATTYRYAGAFWNKMRNRVADAADIREREGYNGSLALPSEFEAKLLIELAKRNIFRQIATLVETNTVTSTIKALVPFGDAAFYAETAAIDEATGEHTSLSVTSHKIAQLVKLTTEFVNNAAFDLQGALAVEFGRSFGKAEEEACVNGDGVSQPYGILHATSGAETGVTAASVSAITFEEVKELYFSVDAEYRRNATWLMSNETAFYLRTLKDTAGSYLWREATDTIFTRPILTTPYMPSIAAGAKPIAFGDFSYYWLIQRGGAMVKPLHEKYAATGHTGFIGNELIDGRLVRSEAVKVLQMAAE